MTRVIVLGAEAALVVSALRVAESRGIAVGERAIEIRVRACQVLEQECWLTPPPASDDPFAGGCRSKGEKKRAARERRMRGGF